MTLTMGTIDTIRALQKQIGAANAAKGFHQDGDDIRSLPAAISGVHDGPRSFLQGLVNRLTRMIPALERHYWMARASLIGTELAELLEDLRAGRGINESWYSATWEGKAYAWVEGERPAFLPNHVVGKPEGAPSEIVDIIVRALDLADEGGVDIAEHLSLKLAYNATRARLHGKKL